MPVRIGVVPSSSPMMSRYVASGPNFTTSVSARRITCMSAMACLLSVDFPSLSISRLSLPPPCPLPRGGRGVGGHGLPHAFGRHRHVEVADTVGSQRVVHRIHERGERAYRARLAHTFGTE